MAKQRKPVPPVVTLPFRYGLVAGLLGAILLVILFYIDRHPFLVPVFFDFRVAFFGVFLFFILRELREYYYQGLLFFWQGMIASAVFVATFAFVASLLLLIFATIVPDFVIKYIELATNQLKTFPKETIEQIGKGVYEKNLAMLPKTTASQLAVLYVVQCLGIGLFVSIIMSVVMRRQPQGTSMMQ